jgi:hypothetical protein
MATKVFLTMDLPFDGQTSLKGTSDIVSKPEGELRIKFAAFS